MFRTTGDCSPRFELDDDADSVAIAFVAYVGYPLDTFVGDQFGDFLDQAGFIDLIGNLCDDDDVAILALPFDNSPGPHRDLPAAGLVCLQDSGPAINETRGWKIRTWNPLVNFGKAGIGFFDQVDHGLAHFHQVVRRHVGRHADGDPARSIYQKIGRTTRKKGRFQSIFIVVRNEVDGVFIDVFEKGFGKRRQARFGVTHGGWRIAVYRTEITLTIDQRITVGKILRHADQRVVNRRCPREDGNCPLLRRRSWRICGRRDSMPDPCRACRT